METSRRAHGILALLREVAFVDLFQALFFYSDRQAFYAVDLMRLMRYLERTYPSASLVWRDGDVVRHVKKLFDAVGETLTDDDGSLVFIRFGHFDVDEPRRDGSYIQFMPLAKATMCRALYRQGIFPKHARTVRQLAQKFDRMCRL